jgi:hypothetical protein
MMRNIRRKMQRLGKAQRNILLFAAMNRGRIHALTSSDFHLERRLEEKGLLTRIKAIEPFEHSFKLTRRGRWLTHRLLVS